jgi:hypothetical protein
MLKKRAHPEYLAIFETEFQEMGEAGMLLGARVPAIGIGCGLLLGILRPLCLGILSQQPGFSQYVRFLRKNGAYYDTNQEKDLLGCSHPQIAALLLTKIGYKRNEALEIFSILEGIPIEQASLDYQCRQASIKVIEDLVHPSSDSRELSAITAPCSTDILINSEIIEELHARPHKSEHAWMQKESKDINDKMAPDLFEKPTPKPIDFNAPEHILNEFSYEELSSFKSIVDELIN